MIEPPDSPFPRSGDASGEPSEPLLSRSDSQDDQGAEPWDRVRSHQTALLDWIERAQRIGLIGPGEPSHHLAGAERFVDGVGSIARERPAGGAPIRLLDMGTGGGLPGLIVAAALPGVAVTLLDAKERSIDALRGAMVELGEAVPAFTALACGRAEDLARDTAFRAQFDIVLSQAFGPPAVVAECATGFLRVGGTLLVSDPPDATTTRWPADGLAPFGLSPDLVLASDEFDSAGSLAWSTESDLTSLRKIGPTPDTYPRRAGIPSRRPLFRT